MPRISYSRKIVGFSISYQSIRGARTSTRVVSSKEYPTRRHAILEYLCRSDEPVWIRLESSR